MFEGPFVPTGPSANLVPSRSDPKDYCRYYGRHVSYLQY